MGSSPTAAVFRPFSGKVLGDLHWREVIAALVSRAKTEPGARGIRSRPFCSSREGVEASLAQVEELVRLMDEEGSGLPFGGIADVVPMLEHASKGGTLEPPDLLAAASVIRALARLREFVEARQERLPLAWREAADIAADVSLAGRIESSFDASGNLVDGASAELGPLRMRVRGLTRSIQARLDAFLHDPAFTPHLRESYYSLRNDRYVFPVLAQSRAAVPGIVHNASQSGQTLFVEPAPLVSMGNDLAIARSMAAEEERRILQELSVRLGARAQDMAVSIEAAAALDMSQAAARLAVDLGLSAPQIVEGDAPFRLRGMRHPLLALKKGEKVVANDLDFEAGTRVLVISGPNAGGKTVTLTGLGLSALMLRFGLPIPAEKGSSLPLFAGVESAVGDDQDLERDLSTFSAHLAALGSISKVVGGGTLVLIDELAADTDPREGAALALAVLEDFAERGARVVITTHLEELKALGLTRERFVNARVGFDPGRMAPTYQLKFGEPGRSSAIEIARRMGLDAGICDRADQVLRDGKGPLGQALAQLEEARRSLEETRRGLEDRRREVERALSELKAARAGVLEKAHAVEIEERARVAGELEAVRREVMAAIRSFQAQPGQKRASELKGLVEDKLRRVNAGLALKEAEAAVPAEERGSVHEVDLVPGMRVQVPGMGEGTVLSSEDGQAVVALGAMKIRRRAGELVALKGRQAPVRKEFPKSQDGGKRLEKMRAAAIESSETRLDLRGMRVDDGVRLADAFLDRCFVEGKLQVTLIHGHGTGLLRKALTDHLAGSPYVRSFRFGDEREGGTGATIVTLRD